MYKNARQKVILLSFLLVAPLLLTGCGLPTKIGEYSKKMGSYMPTYSERCENWFCFGDDKKPANKNSRQNYQERRAVGAPSQAQAAVNKYDMPINPPQSQRNPTMNPRPMPNFNPNRPQPFERYSQPNAAVGGGQQMHPWEENPQWKRDLPPSPIDALQKSLDW